ncbi:Maf family nucleotide pyrophosphatase [Thermoflexibacter ruber]|uniref:dTTP/UTP pyrophosphatase n=1 Tax=Thermoflexibacter ruber TaxID=1003 RepID=A0A1I2K1M1_9BACT|nr:Maf family nucleotide pyrophosphatase [Thermoflexibacter ruber]SFF60198.1 septum formation protein [Thermoflexibacter ruber]
MKNYQLILASQSPRRQQLLKQLGYEFEVRLKETDETVPTYIPTHQVSMFLAEKKANTFKNDLKNNELLITADTIVIIEEEILNKPQSEAEAFEMLAKLSGKVHEVVTGFSLTSTQKQFTDSDTTLVYFKQLSQEEINFYIKNYQPFDKAGSYGAQDWIGMVGIERIEGSYFNVMGLPVHKLYQALQNF